MKKCIRLSLVLILSAFGSGQLNAQITILDQSMLTQASFNTFTPVSVIGAQDWYFGSSTYGAVCSGYYSAQNHENEDWLISPNLNLAGTNNTKLTFSHTRGSTPFVNVGVAEGWYKVFATANYSGDPATTAWIELTGVNQAITVGWQFVSSGELIIPEAAKSANSRIAFRYQSSATQSATWEIKNVKVTADAPVNPNTSEFKITNWNTEWLGCTAFGPTDENLQFSNVAAAMLAMDSDIYCIQEVSNLLTNPSIPALVAIMGSDVWEGRIVYPNAYDCEQRQGIIYKKARVQYVYSAMLSSGSPAQGNSYYYNWSSGRYPARYDVNLVSGANLIPLSIINIHAKAEDGDAGSYTRRLGGSEALKTILDGTGYNTRNLVLIGDFNDYLVGTTSSNCSCTDSPYKNFMDDVTNYIPTTQYLNDAHWNHPLIENIILSNELSSNYVMNSSAQEVAAAQSISDYYNTTSDHLPVSARFQFSTLATPSYSVPTSFTIYPNPVAAELTFEGTAPEDDAAIILYDLAGRKMRFEKTNTHSLNVATLPSGIYILKVGNKFGRFVKN
ncbi:T9SS-dependent choice-of-anchor J family protein [Flavobacterium sangjuense]|nr:T9SS type A sorting domain-containing protein [Flavobacterium sangjuense]